MEEALFIAEYKTTGELFMQRFVWNVYELKHDSHCFFNDITGEELHVYFKHLESLCTKPYFLDDITNGTKNS
jgi:hypothetical protein